MNSSHLYNSKPQKKDFASVLEAFKGVSIESGHQKVVQVLKALEKQGFFEEKSQEKAKETFKEVMQHFGLGVTYVDANGWDYSSGDGELDLSIFHWSRTGGVQYDIPMAANDANRVHLFSAASQYNAAEVPSAYIPPIGEAMEKSAHDHTQGPFAQRTNPVVFELVTAFLTHLGFNMMEYVLPSAGNTYTNGSAIQHGYLRPSNQNVGQLAQEMEEKFRNLEVPCYESRPTNGGQSIFLMLGAAPAIGYSFGLDTNSKECKRLQYYAYLANFTAQFKQSLKLLEENPSKEVVLHVTGTGLGVFGCNNEIFAQAFKDAALKFQTQLKPSDQKRIHVQLEAYNGVDALQNVAQALKLGDIKPRM